MIRLREISEDEVIVLFLQSEISSKRWGERLRGLLEKDNKTEAVILAPNFKSSEENLYRKNLIGRFRGYGMNKDLFEDFPSDMQWYRYSLTRDELGKIKYIDYSYWNKLSDGTRLPRVAAENVKNGVVVFDQPNENFIEASKAFKAGKEFPTVILVGQDENSDLVILEGHLRMTAYYLAPETIPEELEIVIGFSKNTTDWGLY